LLHLDASSSVGVLAWLDNPDVLPVLVEFAQITFIFVIVNELLKLTILLSNFDMESQRQCVIHVFILAAIGIIISHVYEESLLIIQMLVEFQTVVDLLEKLLADFQLRPDVNLVSFEWACEDATSNPCWGALLDLIFCIILEVIGVLLWVFICPSFALLISWHFFYVILQSG
jgi:hypothetical protein